MAEAMQSSWLTRSMAELDNAVCKIGIEHECPDTVLQLDGDVVVLVRCQSAWGCVGIGIVCCGIGDFVVCFCTESCVAVTKLLSLRAQHQ